MKTDDSTMAIRWINRSDLDDVLSIEQQSYPAPMTRIELMDWLTSSDCICLVYESQGRIAGFVMYLLIGTTWLIQDLAVDPAFRFQGVASELIDYLKLGVRHSQGKIICSVRTNNLPALKLFKKHGFGLVEKFNSKQSKESFVRLRYAAE